MIQTVIDSDWLLEMVAHIDQPKESFFAIAPKLSAFLGGYSSLTEDALVIHSTAIKLSQCYSFIALVNSVLLDRFGVGRKQKAAHCCASLGDLYVRTG